VLSQVPNKRIGKVLHQRHSSNYSINTFIENKKYQKKNTNPRITIIKSITRQTKFIKIKIKIKAENVYDSKIIEKLWETKSRPVIAQLDNE